MLDAPITTKHSTTLVTSDGIHVAATGMQGWRLEMEVGMKNFPARSIIFPGVKKSLCVFRTSISW